MKKFIINFAVTFFLGCSICMAQQDFTVKGKITGWPGKYINLETKGENPFKDSVENVDGSFEFIGKTEEVANAFLVNKEGENPEFKFFFLEPGNIQIQGDYKNLASAKVTGSKYTDQYQQIKDIHNAKKNKVDSLYALVDGEKDKEKSKGYFREMEELDKLDIESTKEFIKSHPKNPATIYELGGLSMKLDYPTLKALFDGLDVSVRESVNAEALKTSVINLGNIQVGKIAPNFIQPDSTSKNIQLTDFKGKYVLLDFWASWCIPCRKEHPNLVQAYAKYKEKGFEILGVSIDTKDEEWRWKRAIENDGVTWTQVSDLKGQHNEAAKLYVIQMVPSNFLIDPSGKIIATNLMGDNLNKKLEELLGSNNTF